MSININQIISESKNFREAEGRIRGHLKERADFFRKNDNEVISKILDKNHYLSTVTLMVSAERQKILLATHREHLEVVLKDITGAVLKAVNSSGEFPQGECRSITDLLNAFEEDRIQETGRSLARFLSDIIYQYDNKSMIHISYIVCE